MQQGVEFEQYLTICQSIPATCIIPHQYPLLLDQQNWTHTSQYYKKEVNKKQKTIVN